MGKRKQSNQEQGTMIDDLYGPNAKELIRLGKKYEKIKQERCTLTAKEKEAKTELLDAIKQSGIKPDVDGAYNFTLDGLRFTVTPRDELVRVWDADEGQGGDHPND